jgi:hypothetical protein
MSLPQNTLSSPAVPSAFLPPYDRYKGLLSHDFLGGNGIGDTTGGLNSKVWSATLDSTAKIVSYFTSTNAPTAVLTVTVPIVWLTAAFDQSMRPLIAWTDSNGASWYYWYDSTIPGFTTTALAAGTVRPWAMLDDARIQENSTNDGLVFYITAGGQLHYLQQRDRFGVEYNLGSIPPNHPTFGPAIMTGVGLNKNFRMQFQFQYQGLGMTAWPPVLLSNLVGAIPRIWPIQDDITARSQPAKVHQ